MVQFHAQVVQSVDIIKLLKGGEKYDSLTKFRSRRI